MSQFAAQGSTGMLQNAQLGLASQASWPATAATTIGGPYYTSSPAQTDVSLPPTAEVPIIDKSDKAGLFLRDEAGNLIHVETSRLFKAMGLEW